MIWVGRDPKVIKFQCLATGRATSLQIWYKCTLMGVWKRVAVPFPTEIQGVFMLSDGVKTSLKPWLLSVIYFFLFVVQMILIMLPSRSNFYYAEFIGGSVAAMDVPQ